MNEPAEPQESMPERRAETSVLLALVQTVHDDIKGLHANITELDQRLTKHMTEETTDLAKEISKLMADAFPEGDPTGHRKLHEADIAKAKAKAAFWQKMFYELSKYGLMGFIGWLAIAGWSALVQGPHK
jgi:hypothetical protein